MSDLKTEQKTIRIFRTQKDKSHPYTLLNSEYTNNNELSWRAKGILTYLLSKPDTWKLNTVDLVSQSTEGRDAVHNAIDELIKFNYVKRTKYKDSKGQFQTEYYIYEIPYESDIKSKEENPVTEKPYMDIPKVENPITVNPNMENQSDNNYSFSHYPSSNYLSSNNELVSIQENIEYKTPLTDEQTNFNNLDLNKYEFISLGFIKETIMNITTNELFIRHLGKSLIQLRELMTKLNEKMLDRALTKMADANKFKDIKNPKVYFAKCLITAIEEYGIYSLESKKQNYKTINRSIPQFINFEQRQHDEDYYNNFFNNTRNAKRN